MRPAMTTSVRAAPCGVACAERFGGDVPEPCVGVACAVQGG
jgi:hypothetical protein